MSRKVIVLKFGSSVLRSRADLPLAVHEIYRWIRLQYRVIAVVSAFAGETDRLLGTIADHRDAEPEAIARIVATGEEVATAFLALELDRFGIPAQVLDPSQIQLIAETNSNDTEPASANTAVIEDVLGNGKVAVVPGFVARDRQGRVALFGRGGSDLSALFLAKQLTARCRLIKDVDGIYDSDPAANPKAQYFTEIDFDDALALGGKIVQPKAIAFSKKAGIRFEVSAVGEKRGTVVGAGRSTLAENSGSTAALKIGLLGLGTAGLGVFHEIWKLPDLFEVTGIAVRRPERHADHAPRHLLTRDCWKVLDDIDVLVELIGGCDPAGDLMQAALQAGKPVVTANKLLVASVPHLSKNPGLRYSAAVGGAVPALEAVKALSHSGSGRILSVSGVLNGTCNYILDRLAAGCSWEQAVVEAQAHGFAEQDPTADVSGADTACKLRLLGRSAFPQFETDHVDVTGIDGTDPNWVRDAAADGHCVRLVGSAYLKDGRVHLEVKPKLLETSHPFARIKREENCLLVWTENKRSPHIWTGRGAGRWPTTVAVMADLFDLSREYRAASCEPQTASFQSNPFANQRRKDGAPSFQSLSELSVASNIELPDPRQPSISPFLKTIHGSGPTVLRSDLPHLTTGNWQLTTASGGVA